MKIRKVPLRRPVATTLSLFLALGLGLIGPASALAQGVGRGLTFNVISDDIRKSANGSVPEVTANTDSQQADSAAGGAARESTITAETTATADTTTTDSTASTSYNTSASLSNKNTTNSANGKKTNTR